MLYNVQPAVVALLLLLALLFFYRLGQGVLVWQKNKNAGKEFRGLGPVEGALLGLLSFLLAFTFNMAAGHYEKRRDVVVQEANNIGTALFRADLYPDSVQRAFKSDMRQYIAARIQYYEAGYDETKIKEALNKANNISALAWKRIAYYSKQPGDVIRSMQMIPAMNAVMDSVNNREEARQIHVPVIILWLLLLLCLMGSLVIGYLSTATRADRVVAIIYSFAIAMTFYLILDLEKPRSGFINTNFSHQFVYELAKLNIDEK